MHYTSHHAVVSRCTFILFQGVREDTGDRVELYSDEDEDYSSPEEGSDSEPMTEDPSFRHHPTPRSMGQPRKLRDRSSGKGGHRYLHGTHGRTINCDGEFPYNRGCCLFQSKSTPEEHQAEVCGAAEKVQNARRVG